MARNPGPEIECLFLASKWTSGPGDRDRIARLVKSDLDWEKLLNLAEDHGVSGMLYKKVESVEAPETARERLKAAYAETWARTTGALTSFTPALEALGRAGIPVILLKGVVLVETLYEDPGLRPLLDVDILVRPEDVQNARAVLIEMGFEPWDDFIDHLERGPLVIELHASFSDTDRIDRRRHTAQIETEALWERARPYRTGAPHAFQLAREDHLLYLCRHLLKHSYDSLIWFTDVAAFVHRHEADLNWPLLFDRARENALYPTLIFTLRFLLEHIGEDLPRPIIEEAAAAPRRHLENLILVRLARRLDIGPLANLLLLPTIARFPDRVAFLWEASFPRDNVMKQIYPSYRKGRRIWFCTLRLFHLVGLGALTAFRLLIPGRRERPLRKV